MFDHVTLRVGDLAAAEPVFQSLLDQLALDETHRTRSIAVWGDFALAQAEEGRPATRRAHVALAARTREAVDAFWAAGLAAGLAGDRPPGPAAQDGALAYAAALRDERENTVAAVHRPGRRGGGHGGHVDHVALHVADLPAALGFYRGVADAVGLEVRREDEERAVLAGRGTGGSLALVAGPATEHLHVAFPGDDAAVRAFFAAAVGAGHRPNGEPGERARYHPGYFAAYVLDPDGNNIEVVDHHEGWAA